MFWRKTKLTEAQRQFDAHSTPLELPPLLDEFEAVPTQAELKVIQPLEPSLNLHFDAANASIPSSTVTVPRKVLFTDEQHVAFGKIISVFTRNGILKNYTLADLDWLVVPPVLAGTYGIINRQSKAANTHIPAAVILWACVSAEVDQRLTVAGDDPVRLEPHDWQSGGIVWFVESAGDREAVAALREHLIHTKLRGRIVKTRQPRLTE